MMGYPMQIKINFLCATYPCRSVLLDLTLLSDSPHAPDAMAPAVLELLPQESMHDFTKGEEPVNNLFDHM
jgi:myo-inositol-1-phosphate synthase